MWREETHWGFLVSDLVGNVWRKKEGCSPFPDCKWGREREALKEKLINIGDACKKMGETGILLIVGRLFGQHFANMSLFLRE